MYTIIFVVAFLVVGYLQHTHKALAARAVFALVMLAGFALVTASMSDHRWQNAVSGLYTALIIVVLVELYVKINGFEVKK
jgi:hypothetical protein